MAGMLGSITETTSPRFTPRFARAPASRSARSRSWEYVCWVEPWMTAIRSGKISAARGRKLTGDRALKFASPRLRLAQCFFMRSRGGDRLLPGLAEYLDRAFGVVGDGEDGEVLDLGLHPIALDDSGSPRTRIESLGVLERFPLVHASRDAVLSPDEMLADQAFRAAKTGRDLGEVSKAGVVVDRHRELVAHDCGD